MLLSLNIHDECLVLHDCIDTISDGGVMHELLKTVLLPQRACCTLAGRAVTYLSDLHSAVDDQLRLDVKPEPFQPRECTAL